MVRVCHGLSRAEPSGPLGSHEGPDAAETRNAAGDVVESLKLTSLQGDRFTTLWSLGLKGRNLDKFIFDPVSFRLSLDSWILA